MTQVKETYKNLKVLFNLTKWQRISFKFVVDYKVTNCFKRTNCYQFPSKFCHISWRTLHGLEGEDTIPHDYLAERVDWRLGFGQPLTLVISEKILCTLGKSKRRAKECESTINPPLFEELDEMVSEKVIFPELQVFEGNACWTRELLMISSLILRFWEGHKNL